MWFLWKNRANCEVTAIFSTREGRSQFGNASTRVDENLDFISLNVF